jgi:hypothetical protein
LAYPIALPRTAASSLTGAFEASSRAQVNATKSLSSWRSNSRIIPSSSLPSTGQEIAHDILNQFAQEGFEYLGKAKSSTPQWLKLESARISAPATSSSKGESRSLITSQRPATSKQQQQQQRKDRVQQKAKREKAKQQSQQQQQVEVYRITLPGDLYQAK